MTDYLAQEPPVDADAAFRNFMRHSLARAADHFGLIVTGEPVMGWRLRSIGAPVRSRGGACWLRVVTEQPQWLPAGFWTGNVDANLFTDVAKPRVLDVTEWDERGWRHVRAELMTLMPGHPCSPTDVLRAAIELPSMWWERLRRAVDVISSTPTKRWNSEQDKITRRVHAAFGAETNVRVEQWETVHGDLHWSNVFAPEFGLLDWELWGRGPAGCDAATLYCYSLLVPATARTVHEVFADMLDTPAGRVAQVYVAARLFNRIGQGDFPDLAEPLRAHIRPLVEWFR